MLVYEACRTCRTRPCRVTTPMGAGEGRAHPRPPLVVPVLRAGLGLHGAVLRLLPETDTAFIGVSRNEDDVPARALHELGARRPGRPAGAWPSTRCSPPAGRWRTPAGCSPTAAPGAITGVCVLAAPEGIAHIEAVRAGRPRRHRRGRRPPRRARLHRPRPRRRRRPPLRDGLSRSGGVARPARRRHPAPQPAGRPPGPGRRRGPPSADRDHRLGVALELGLGARRADDSRTPSPRSTTPSVGGRPPAEAQVLDLGDRRPRPAPPAATRPAGRPRPACGPCRRRPRRAIERWPVACTPSSRARSSSRSSTVRPRAFSAAASSANASAAVMPSLSRTSVPTHDPSASS